MNERRVRFAPRFTQEVRHLQKRYRRLGNDLRPLITQLRNGETPGDRLQGLAHRVYKVRVQNSDARRGKSGGYRVIYYLQTDTQTVVLTIYSKTDQSDLPAAEIRRVIEEYES